METNDRQDFIRMLQKAMGAYAKQLPDVGLIEIWIELLRPYTIRTVAMAFKQYLDENSDFEPKPASIAKLCKLMDGRLGVEEAWAIALTSQDEAETVVWTDEMAQAFALCKPVLDAGDEVGARMSFKETYSRLVTEARLINKKVNWIASIGWDINKRSTALKKASIAGLLSAPSLNLLLPSYKTEIKPDDNAKEQLKKIKEMMNCSGFDRVKHNEELLLIEREKVANRKRELDLQAKNL